MIKIMKFLLVVPRFSYKDEFYMFPFGLAYISSYLKSKGHNVSCLNLCHYEETYSTAEILRTELSKGDAESKAVLTGCMSCDWNLMADVLDNVKKIDPGIITIGGGPIVTSDPELAMENLKIDFGVIGEGEITAEELCSALEGKIEINTVDGIIFRENGRLKKTKERAPIKDLDMLPMPDYEGFGYGEWVKLVQYSESNPVLENYDNILYAPIFGSRSCPFSCTFCYHPLGNVYRQRSVDNIFLEIDHLVKNYNVNFVGFCDELFSTNTSRMFEVADRIKQYGIKWDAEFRVNSVSKEILERLKDSNLVCIGYGVESLSDKILLSMKKMIKKSEIENAFKITSEAGIYSAGNIILGDPEETLETINESIDWWKSHPQYSIALKFIKAIPDSQDYRYALENNLIKDKLKHIKEGFPIVNMTKIPDKQFWSIWKEVQEYNKELRYMPEGKIVKSEKTCEKYQKYNFYLLTAKCSHCGHVDTYKKFTRSIKKYSTIMCKKCLCSLKIKQREAFYEDYRSIKFFFKMRLNRTYIYLLKKNIINRQNKTIIKIKNLLKNI